MAGRTVHKDNMAESCYIDMLQEAVTVAEAAEAAEDQLPCLSRGSSLCDSVVLPVLPLPTHTDSLDLEEFAVPNSGE